MNDVKTKCLPIRLILSDVDGVLTTGGVQYNNQGVELKTFHVRDGFGIQLWQNTGSLFGLITGRTSQIVCQRATELSISILRQGVREKWDAVEEIIHSLEMKPENVCFIGDDFPDLPIIQAVGLGVAVADAPDEIKERADYITFKPGGKGAVREVIELILKTQRRWESAVQKYTQPLESAFFSKKER